jgi:hypothetical protein
MNIMPRLSIWNNGKKGNDYKFLDNTIREYFHIGGTAAYIHKYLGPTEVDGKLVENPDAADPINDPNGPRRPLGSNDSGETMIQDVLFLENRDRRYAPDIIELKAIYTINDTEFDLRQFGFFLDNDSLYIQFHTNDMVSILGRKLVAGDVVELPHQRDEHLLGDKPAINKFYVVEEGSRATEGYSQTWFPHVWRVKCKTMTASQEYDQILQANAVDPFGLPTDKKLLDLMSNLQQEFNLNDAILEEAKANVSARNFDTRQFYVVPGDDLGEQFPWVFAGDGVPPNGAELVGSGNSFPMDAREGDHYLRTDYEPHNLFRKLGPKWVRIEMDYRKGDWSMAHRLLSSFINNKTKTVIPAKGNEPAKVFNEKQALSKAIKPRADF